MHKAYYALLKNVSEMEPQFHHCARRVGKIVVAEVQLVNDRFVISARHIWVHAYIIMIQCMDIL